MAKPIVIVDPRSSGSTLAPSFIQAGYECIGITYEAHREQRGFARTIEKKDFKRIILFQDNIEEKIKDVNPLAIIPGAERGVELSETLTNILTPEFSNISKVKSNRLNKMEMQQALAYSGIPHLKTFLVKDLIKAEALVESMRASGELFILKPPDSAGSENVFHINSEDDWRIPFFKILNGQSNVSGIRNSGVILQEMALGTEYAVGTVTAAGKHHLAHLIKYKKMKINGRATVYECVEFVDLQSDECLSVYEYTKDVLDALGIRWGACHNEVIFTENGPRLIESVPRMTGGPVVHFARLATGSSQADMLVDAYTKGAIKDEPYTLKSSLLGAFVNSTKRGILKNVEVLNRASGLETFCENHLWVKNGDFVEETVDYLTSLGVIAFTGDRAKIFDDYHRLRKMESQLIIQDNEKGSNS